MQPYASSFSCTVNYRRALVPRRVYGHFPKICTFFTDWRLCVAQLGNHFSLVCGCNNL